MKNYGFKKVTALYEAIGATKTMEQQPPALLAQHRHRPDERRPARWGDQPLGAVS